VGNKFGGLENPAVRIDGLWSSFISVFTVRLKGNVASIRRE